VPFYCSDDKDDSCFESRIRSVVELQDSPVIVVEDQPFARATFNPTTEHYLAEIAQTICHVQPLESLLARPYVRSRKLPLNVGKRHGIRWFAESFGAECQEPIVSRWKPSTECFSLLTALLPVTPYDC